MRILERLMSTAQQSNPEGVRHPRDVELARSARAGSAKDRRELADRLRCVPRVLYALNRRLGGVLSPEDLEDLAQDVAAKVWRRLNVYSGQSALESWFFGFCQNVLSERMRARRRRPAHLHAPSELDTGRERAVPLLDDEGRAALRAALAEMRPREDAEIISLKHFESLSYEELGAHYGITANAAKKRYHKSLERLRTALEPLKRRGVL